MSMDGCTTPLFVNALGFSNKGQVTDSAIGATNVAWPDLKSTDRVTLTLAGALPGVAAPGVSFTPGVQFTLGIGTGATWNYVVR